MKKKIYCSLLVSILLNITAMVIKYEVHGYLYAGIILFTYLSVALVVVDKFKTKHLLGTVISIVLGTSYLYLTIGPLLFSMLYPKV